MYLSFFGITFFLTQIYLASLSVGNGCLPKRILDRNLGQERTIFAQGNERI